MNNPIAPSPVAAEVRMVEGSAEHLKSIALRSLEKVREIKAKKKDLAERKKALFEDNQAVSEAEAQAEEYVQAVKTAKEGVKATQAYAELDAEMKELNSELKEYGETINAHLFEFSRQTGQNFIEDADGNTLKIKHQVQVKNGQLRLF